jgi:cobalt-zinc-cadmium efflux system membrane fusion protein
MKPTLTSLIFLSTALLFGCNKTPTTTSTAPQNEASSSTVIDVTTDLHSRLTLGEVRTHSWTTKLKVSGTIELDELRVARVGTTVSGRVTEIKHLRGDRVKKGDVLAWVHSPALAEAQLTYLKAYAAFELAQKSTSRAKFLFAEGVIAEAELQRRQSELLSSEAEWQAAKDRMFILGMSNADITELNRKRQINSTTALRASIDGVVMDRKVSQGQVLEPADLAFTIAELSQVWVVGEVPERYSAQMHRGKVVQVIIPALSDETRTTQLNFVADTVTPQTRTLRVSALLDNRDGRLKPDMLATLQIDNQPEQRLVIPAAAVMREDNKDQVFVQIDDTHYRIQTVQLGEEMDGLRDVQSGLAVGQVIVVDGVFQLNAERLLK